MTLNCSQKAPDWSHHKVAKRAFKSNIRQCYDHNKQLLCSFNPRHYSLLRPYMDATGLQVFLAEGMSPTWTMRPTELKSVRTSSASSSLALPPRHMALAVSPTRQGVLGITRTSLVSSPAASCTHSTPINQMARKYSGSFPSLPAIPPADMMVSRIHEA